MIYFEWYPPWSSIHLLLRSVRRVRNYKHNIVRGPLNTSKKPWQFFWCCGWRSVHSRRQPLSISWPLYALVLWVIRSVKKYFTAYISYNFFRFLTQAGYDGRCQMQISGESFRGAEIWRNKQQCVACCRHLVLWSPYWIGGLVSCLLYSLF